MKSFISLVVSLLLLFTNEGYIYGQSRITKSKNPSNATYFSLDGQALAMGNTHDTDGNIHKFSSPALHVVRTKSNSPKGTMLLFPGGEYEILNLKHECEKMVSSLNTEGYDVAILEYHIKDPGVRNMALVDAMKAFRLLKSDRKSFGLRGDRLDIIGLSSGGHLAARTVQKLGDNEQPDDLILISPEYLNETLNGTVFPAVMPPLQPTARLFVSFSIEDNKAWIQSGEEYSKIWKGYDGQSSYYLSTDSA